MAQLLSGGRQALAMAKAAARRAGMVHRRRVVGGSRCGVTVDALLRWDGDVVAGQVLDIRRDGRCDAPAPGEQDRQRQQQVAQPHRPAAHQLAVARSGGLAIPGGRRWLDRLVGRWLGWWCGRHK